MDETYIYLERKIMQTSFYQDSKTTHLAIHCLLRANHTDRKKLWNGQEMIIPRGSFVTGLHALNKETGISIQSLRTSLRNLSACGFLTIKSTNRFSHIFIGNYGKYQCKLTSKLTNNQQTTNKQLTTDKELKELNETTLKPLTDIQKVVEHFKTVRGYDKTWDKANFGRASKAAKTLLAQSVTVENACEAINRTAGKNYDDWTLETVARKYQDVMKLKPHVGYKLTPEDEAKIKALQEATQ